MVRQICPPASVLAKNHGQLHSHDSEVFLGEFDSNPPPMVLKSASDVVFSQAQLAR